MRIRDTSKTLPKINVVGITEKKIDPAYVAEVLGAELITEEQQEEFLRKRNISVGDLIIATGNKQPLKDLTASRKRPFKALPSKKEEEKK